MEKPKTSKSKESTDKVLVSIVNETHDWFSAEAFDLASKDFLSLFLNVYAKARKLAVEDAENEAAPKILIEQWKRAYWEALQEKKRKGRYGNWKILMRWANRAIPFVIGFLVDPRIITAPSQVNPSILLPVLIITLIYWVTTFIEEKMEDEK